MHERVFRATAQTIAPYVCACAALMASVGFVACDDDDAPRDAATSTPAATSAPRPTATLAPDPEAAASLSYAGEYEAAIDAYAAVVERGAETDRQRARFAQAQLLVRTERHDEARPVLEAFLVDAGVSGDAHVARFMHASLLAQTGDITGALASYQRHIDAGGPLQGYAYAEQALLLAGAGRLDEARVAASATANPNARREYVASFALRAGDAFAAAGADADALIWYDRARINGGDAPAALTRGGALKRRLGDPSWISDYLTVIEGYPESAVAVSLLDELDAVSVAVSDYLRGVVEYRAGRDADARETFARAIAAGDHAAESTYYTAAIDERAGAIDAAIEGYAQVPALNAASPLADNALWWRGRLLEGLGRYDKASASYGQLVDAYPASEWTNDARFHRGSALFRAGSHAPAAFVWAAMAAEAPDDQRAKLLFWQGRAELAADLPNARTALQTIIDQHPGDFYALRAEVLLGTNDTSDDEPALETPPSNWDVVAEAIESQLGLDPRIEPTQTPEGRWAIAAALEDAGMHVESDVLYREIINDSPSNAARLYRTARRLDDEGRTSLAARAAVRLISSLEASSSTPAPDALYRVAYPLAYGDLVESAALGEGVPPLLLLALVRQESFYDPQAGSSAGALGLTQVIEPTGRAIADALGVDAFAPADLYRPRLSLRFGASYIADQLASFDGNPYYALAAYNGGPGAASNAIDTAGGDVDLFVEDLEFDETRLYIVLVMENYARYRHLYANIDRPSLPE